MKFSNLLENSYRYFFLQLIISFLIILIFAVDLSAQNYEFTLNQRRRYDQIQVEIWAKSLNQNAPKLGYATLIVQYNTTYLSPAAAQSLAVTDSVDADINKANPIITINSGFNNINGYTALGSQGYTSGNYSLEINLARLGTGGLAPASTARGSFLGKLTFDIIGNPPDNSLTGVQWSRQTMPGDIRIFDADSNDIETQVTLTDPGNFKVIGITILSPNNPNVVADLNGNYASLSGAYANGGLPLYFERSINPSVYKSPVGKPPAIDEDLAYAIDFSLDSGMTWNEFGRVVETDRDSRTFGNNNKYRSGNIFNPNITGAYTITSQDGNRILEANYRNPLRVIWKNNNFFSYRSENAKLRINILNGTINDIITTRPRLDLLDTCNAKFILGGMFFLQLDGKTQYFRTPNNFSNATQLTAECWINLNGYKGTGSEPGIIATSGGPDATALEGSREGAWMLYLKDGYLPAFRVREVQRRGTNGYMASLVAYKYDSLKSVSKTDLLSDNHARNWVHIAATVKNNETCLYVNGELVDKYINTNATDIRMLTTNHPLWIGVNPNITIDSTDYLDAGIKEVRIWRVALTQDQIRERVGGVINPADVSQYGDLRRGLEYYYSFEGISNDLANDPTYQSGAENLDLYVNNSIDNSKLVFRPDKPHITITAPSQGVGVLNQPKSFFEIRWVAYGFGDIANPNSKDIEIQYSTDSGTNWFNVKDTSGIELGTATAPDVEVSKILWEPYQNNVGANLRTITPYNRVGILRIKGTTANTQENLIETTGDFNIAPHFSIQKTENSIIMIPGTQGMNITGNSAFIEAWIRPYRFPTATEKFFPIISKFDSTTNKMLYSLNLLSTGQLQLQIMDRNGKIRMANSDIVYPLVRPNSVAIDTPWTHIGAYIFLNNGTGSSEVRFYIDGLAQRSDLITTQLGPALSLTIVNSYPTFIGYLPLHNELIDSAYNDGTGQTKYYQVPTGNSESPRGFIGEIREVRFWNGSPNNQITTGEEPNAMSLFVQGALSINSKNLIPGYNANLMQTFGFNGGTFVHGGIHRAIGSSLNPSIYTHYYGVPIKFVPVEPYIKLVEPVFREKISNAGTQVRVRWVGFDYDSTGFRGGSAGTEPSLEFSLRGGGGNVIQPYQYLGGLFWLGNKVNSMTIPDTVLYRFKGTGKDSYYAARVDFTIADPDDNNDGNFNDPGPLAASLTNARLRLTAQYTIYGEKKYISSEGPLFSVTPASNLTVRVLLEGYHNGSVTGKLIQNLKSKYDLGGLKIKLYRDNSGVLGSFIDSAESSYGYDNRDPVNRNRATNRFGNVNFIFTDLTDGNYWIVVEQINHLPIMSRFAAPFKYEGDDRSTWAIESGWDFESWNGIDDNLLAGPVVNPWLENNYTAYGDAVSTYNNPRYSTTGLIYNNGVAGGSVNPMPAMVAGDVQHDGIINAADRVRVRLDDGTSLVRSDVTGDGVTNADDRTITDRNFGKVSSLYNVVYQKSSDKTDPFGMISELDPEMSRRFNDAAKNPRQIKTDKHKENITQASFNYEVSAVTEVNDKYIDLKMYIRNKGADFALANATFAVTYNTSSLKFVSLVGQEEVIFSNKPEKGYATLRSAPEANAQNPLPNVRTIEVDYDAYAMLDGEPVPSDLTYLGTLRFEFKNKSGTASFAWHYSTSVHTTKGEVVTEFGEFKEIEKILLYTAQLTTPNGGESYSPNKKYNISWNTTSAATAYLEYSIDQGSTWNRVSQDTLLVETKSYQWTIPDVSSIKCLVRLIDAETGIELDRSDNVFAIVPNFAQITRPSSGDPVYTGGSTDKIIWSSKGYNYVKFEFSYDGGVNNWTSVSTKILADNATDCNWKIPTVTTKSAVVRMLDAETGQEITRTGMFRVLAGSIAFRNPRESEVLVINRQTRIRWNSSGISQFDIDISLDGGYSWQNIATDVAALKTYLDWDIPNDIDYVSDEAILRALWNGDPEMEYCRTGLFTITSIGDVNDNAINAGEFGFIYPNPCSHNAIIEFYLPIEQKVEILLYNNMGQVVKNLSSKYYTPGNNTINININNMSSGAYYLNFKTETFNIIRDLYIIK